MSRGEPLRFGVRSERTWSLVHLAWPTALSYILNNAYRINDQFWIQGLGDEAQAAIGATFFVQVLNFAAIFLAVGGTLALVSRRTGARDAAGRDAVSRHALGMGLVLGAGLAAVSLPIVPRIVGALGLVGEPAAHGVDYLATLYWFLPSLALFPVLDAIFIGRGNTRVPMALQACAVVLNYVLNPLLIYGPRAGEEVSAPGAAVIAALAADLGIEGQGIAGAAMATGIARTSVVLIGFCVLRFGLGTDLLGGRSTSWGAAWSSVRRIARISGPPALSIAIYALAYWGLLGLVLGRLDHTVTAGLGLGFQVFEGLAFPCYLGVSIAGASLVGRELGAGNREGVLEAVGSTRFVARVLGLGFAAAFWFGGTYLVPVFTEDAGVARETLGYVHVLALSQYWVAVEAVNERVLLGSGRTGPILWISPLGNLLRVPLAWVLATGLGHGAAGVWWAINLTTYLKAFLFWRNVQAGAWLEEALGSDGG